MPDNHTLSMDQLRVGLYVHLDLKWFEHPFAFGDFKIKSEEQIRIIRSLGLKTVRFSPDLSEGTPPPPVAASSAPGATAVAPPTVSPEPELTPVMLAKRAMMAQMQLRRKDAERIEKAFVNTASAIRDIEKNMFSKPLETVQQATKLIAQITDSILSAPELAIHVMGDKMGGEELYFHSLNVTMLSMMIARDLKLPAEVVGALGLGALLHDIGRKEVPDKILRKTEALTQAERNFYEMHCQYGVDIGQRMQLVAPVLAIIREHHELFDGTGYPAKLKGESTSLLSRIVVIANFYDELCNPPLIADALTPHEALSLMFAKLRGKFDPKLLQVFIRCLGVYPPGSIVQLSNGAIGMVATVNTARPMKPTVVVYDADIPKEEAMLLDMERETEVNIAKAIRPAQVSRDVYNYLSPRKRVSYYFDASSSRPEAGKP
ncbi:HD-GYP domain-containing protein [Rhodoferax sp. UBA5149]|uniref:HD-GYP domain-containing protein n=1 Tax=Rhodoferax sp. UBA5149 TaxID=1947379 RepID=UPI0025FD5EBC|nr:HD domain-containing phosphohydrolase [Rhodoferax sp. UBA5149]